MFWLEFTLSFSQNVVDQTWKDFNTKFGPQSKDQEISYWVRQLLTFLDWNCGTLELQKLSNKYNSRGPGTS